MLKLLFTCTKALKQCVKADNGVEIFWIPGFIVIYSVCIINQIRFQSRTPLCYLAYMLANISNAKSTACLAVTVSLQSTWLHCWPLLM